MLLPELQERSLRFKLALRMVLPLFLLVSTVFVAFFFDYVKDVKTSFITYALVVLGVSAYYALYLIYRAFDEKITDNITHTFTREPLLKILKDKIKNQKYTIILMSIDNLQGINSNFGSANGDKVLRGVVKKIGSFLNSKNIDNFPIGHLRGGDFLIGLNGDKAENAKVLDLFCIKYDHFLIDDIEVQLSGAIADNTIIDDLEHIIERLVTLQSENRESKYVTDDDNQEIDPNELETKVLEAVKDSKFSIMYQRVKEHNHFALVEISVKLLTKEEKFIHQKSYIKVMNRLGITRDFDLQVLKKVLLNLDDENLIFTINMTPSTIRNNKFYDEIAQMFSNNSSYRGRIAFILSEKEYYNNIARYSEIINSYRRMGIYIILDKFGSYFTSELYLKDLDVDIIRFDTIYTKNLKNLKYKALMQGIIVAAHTMETKVWVKMIENEEIKEILDEMGVDLFQGNYIEKLKAKDEIW